MKVDWQLRRLEAPLPATMLLLVSHQADDLLRLCASLGCEPLPPIYAVPDGFLIRLPQATSQAFPGAIRLRSLAENLLLPVDAELVPSLLPDEALDLVKHRGLVFLPGRRVLEFRPKEELSLSDLLALAKKPNPSWQPLPRLMPLAERISEIALDLPPPPADELLESGAGDIGSEPARPEDSSPVSKLAGGAKLAMGKALVRLGNWLHLQALLRLGAKWMAGALTLAPRLSEKLLGAQEAALRALLREFQEGDSERALRRALPLGGDTIRGGVPASNALLPFQNIRYSLSKILGRRPGPVGFWFGGVDVHRELEREYRKQAELATQRGDYRRAAFIYAKLLGDYRLAAQVLERGGLHFDAAAIYLEKLQDSLAAAQAFEAGGDHDRALELYRRRGDHERAGDLLLRIGEDEAALGEYEIAARKLIESSQDYLRAGELMLSRARRPDLALGYFEAGWSQRPRGNPVPCALRMAKLYASSEAPERLLELVSDAEKFLDTAEAGLAGEFLNEIAQLADDPHLEGLRDELRDRALLGLAGKMRQWAKGNMAPGRMVSVLFGQSAAWSAPVVSDAHFAAKVETQRAASSQLTEINRSRTIIQGAIPIVTAVCWAPETEDVFLGFASGEVVCYRPSSGEVIPLPFGPSSSALTIFDNEASGISLFQGGPVTCLATGPRAMLVVALSEKDEEPPSRTAKLISFSRRQDGTYTLRQSRLVPVTGRAWLSSVSEQGIKHTGIWTGDYLQLLAGASLLPVPSLEAPGASLQESLVAGLLLAEPELDYEESVTRIGLLLMGANSAWHYRTFVPQRPRGPIAIGWTPAVPEGSTLHNPPLAWGQTGQSLELAGITHDGCLCWSRLSFSADGADLVTTNYSNWPLHDFGSPDVKGFRAATHGCYLATAIIRPGFIVGVTKDRIDWLMCTPKRFLNWRATKIDFPSPIACFPHYRSNELILISSEGTLGREPMPR